MAYFRCISYICAVCPLLFAVQDQNLVWNGEVFISSWILEEWCQISIWKLCKYSFLQHNNRSQDCQQPTKLEYPATNVTGHLACYTVDSVLILCICSDDEWSTLLPKDGKCFKPEPGKHAPRSYELPKLTRKSYGSCRAESATVSNSLCHLSAAFVIKPSFLPSHSFVFRLIHIFPALHDRGWGPVDNSFPSPCNPDLLHRQCSKVPSLLNISRGFDEKM